MRSRREILALLGTPILARCAGSTEQPISDGRFFARPRKRAMTSSATPKPQPLALGKNRDGFFYNPARKDPAPLLVYLHGAGGSGDVMQYLTGHADSTGTVVITPDSRARTWGMMTGDEQADVEFINAALQKIFDTCPIDPARIGIGGFSDGATAALSWGLVNGDLFSAIVAFSPGGLVLAGPPKGKPRIFISHGVDDQILPIDR